MKVRVFLANVGLRRPLYPLATPPMGLLYLAAYLRRQFDTEIRIVNQRLDNISADELARQAAAFDPHIVGLSSFTTFAFMLGEVSRKIKQVLPNALLAIGGPHVSATGVASLEKTAADLALPGEGELGFEQIIHAWLERAGFDRIPGLFWRSADGQIIHNPGTLPLIEDLDSLPMPAYDLIDVPAYWRRQSIAPVYRRRYISLMSSRGCPYGCMWCHKIFGRRIRFHSADRMVEEMACFGRTYHVNDFEFLDDTFNFRRPRVLQFADELHRRDLKVRLAFPTAIRGDIVTQEVVDALSSAGTYLCGFSLETGAPRLQQLMNKRLDIPKFLKAVEMTARRGIYVTGFCMMGFPTETEDELQQTIDVACASRFHTASFFTVTPYPGTPLYDYVQQHTPEKLARIDYENMDLSAMNVNLTDLPDQVLYNYQRKAMRKFFMNPRRIASLIRAYPQPWMLPVYGPIFLSRATKGLWSSHGARR